MVEGTPIRRTTLILGAGASAPYSFPLGTALKNSLIQGHGGFDSLLSQLGGPQLNVDAWIQVRARIRRSESDSVDEFLSRYPEHADLVKMAVAHELTANESIDSLVDPGLLDHWYKILLREYLGDSPEFAGGEFTIITFNYDLSLEMYLLTQLMERFRMKTTTEALASIAKLRIAHVYGSLGPVAPLDGQGRQYTRIAEPSILLAMRDGIATCFEQRSLHAVEEAQQQIRESERVLMLGFGCSEQNLDRLDLAQNLRPEAHVLLSVYRCPGAVERVRQRMARTEQLHSWAANSSTPAVDTARQFLAMLAELEK